MILINLISYGSLFIACTHRLPLIHVEFTRWYIFSRQPMLEFCIQPTNSLAVPLIEKEMYIIIWRYIRLRIGTILYCIRIELTLKLRLKLKLELKLEPDSDSYSRQTPALVSIEVGQAPRNVNCNQFVLFI